MKNPVEISLIALIAILVAVALYLGMSGEQPRPEPDNPMDAMLQYVPADTPLVMMGKGTPENIDYTDAMLRRSNPQDLEVVMDMFSLFTQSDQPGMLGWLMNDYIQTSAKEGVAGLTERYGVDMLGVYSVYFHGAAPVINMPLSQPAALEELLAQAQADTGVTPRRETLADGSSLRIWPLADDSDIELALLIGEDAAIFSVVHATDDESTRLQRFAREPSADPLFDSALLQTLRDDYAQPDVFLGYLDIHRIVETALLPQQNATGRQLQQWFPALYDGPTSDLNTACRNDILGLVAQAPVISMGAQSMELRGQELHQRVGSLWSMENAAALNSLQKLQGFIPDYSRRSDDKLFAFALGANIGELVPATTELWIQFTDASFECEQLQELQLAAQNFNPAMLGMMGVSMAESVRGVGAALYDLNQDAESPEQLPGSLLVSIATDNPAAIASLAGAYLPQLAGVVIPEDGTPVTLANLPGVDSLQAAIKGEHLVFYRGEPAQRDAEALADQPLAGNGLFSIAFNVSDPTSWIDAADDLAMEGCNDMRSGLMEMSQVPMRMVMGQHFSDRGWVGDVEVDMVLPDILSADNLAGRYEIAQLNDHDCQWQPLGEEELNPDGTGRFVATDESLDCADYQSEFIWALTGSLMEQKTTVERQRESCDDQWRELHETDDFRCAVMSESDQGFYCLHQASLLETEVYRYLAQ